MPAPSAIAIDPARAHLPYRRNVGIMLVNGNGLVFAARRLTPSNAWQMPQGGIDEGESVQEAGLREMAEEIGTDKAEVLGQTSNWLRYDFPPGYALEVNHNRYRGQEQLWLLARFTGTNADINLATEHPEFDAWRWMEPAEVIGLIVPFKRAIYEAVIAEFLPLIRV